MATPGTPNLRSVCVLVEGGGEVKRGGGRGGVSFKASSRGCVEQKDRREEVDENGNPWYTQLRVGGGGPHGAGGRGGGGRSGAEQAGIEEGGRGGGVTMGGGAGWVRCKQEEGQQGAERGLNLGGGTLGRAG